MWWTHWPNAWIALLCGCGLVVIDVDTGEAHNNVDGFVRLRSWAHYPRRVVYVLQPAGRHLPAIRSAGPFACDWPWPRTSRRKPIRHRTAKSRLRGDLRRAAGTVAGLAVRRAESGRQGGKETTPWPTVATAELPKPLYLKVLRLVPLSAVVTRHHQRRVIGILNIALQRWDHRNDGLNIAGFCMRELIRNRIISSPAAEELLIEVAILNGYAAKDGFTAVEKTIRSGLGLAP